MLFFFTSIHAERQNSKTWMLAKEFDISCNTTIGKYVLICILWTIISNLKQTNFNIHFYPWALTCYYISLGKTRTDSSIWLHIENIFLINNICAPWVGISSADFVYRSLIKSWYIIGISRYYRYVLFQSNMFLWN